MNQLPNDIIIYKFSEFLNPNDIINFGRTSKEHNHMLSYDMRTACDNLRKEYLKLRKKHKKKLCLIRTQCRIRVNVINRLKQGNLLN